MAKMIHSGVWDSKRSVLKDSRLLHIIKFVGAVSNFHVNIKHIQIDVEDGTRLVRVIFWRKGKECTAQGCLIDECNSIRYICVCVLTWAPAREDLFAILEAFEPHCMDPPRLAS
jgi:hypothetical protein